MAFISKSNWSPSCNANPLHRLSFSRCRGNKWSDGIWTDLAAILKSNFLLPLSLCTATAGKNYGSKKNKASAVLRLAALSNKNFCIFSWMKKGFKKGIHVQVWMYMCSAAQILCQINVGNPHWVQSCCIPHRALHGKGSKEEEEGKGREVQRSRSFVLPSLGSSFLLLWRWVNQDPAKGAAPSLQNQQETLKMAQLNAHSSAFFSVGKGLLLESKGKSLSSKSWKRRCFRKKKREKKGCVSIWVHLYNIPSGAVVWLTSVGRAPGYRNLSSISLAREPQETTITLVLWETLKEGI